MFKKILLFILLLGMPAFAADNYLNSVVLSDSNAIILRSDKVAKIKKEFDSSDRLLLTLKGVKQSPDISTLYKNTNLVNGLIIQTVGNELKIYIDAPDIVKSDIIFETPNSAPIKVNDGNSEMFLIWSIISLAMFLGTLLFVKNTKSEPHNDINEIIKEREKELYKNFQKEVAALPSMNYKLKSYRKHVLNGETIRSYKNRHKVEV